MALFDIFRKKPGWTPGIGDGLGRNPYETPGIGDGQMGNPMSDEGAQTKGSFFDTGQIRGKDWLGLALGAVGDAFAQQSGGQAMMTPMVMGGIANARKAKQKSAAQQGTIEALKARGIPESEAAVLANDQSAVSKILGSKYETQQDEWGYEQDNAGNLHRYNKRTGVFDPKPVFVDPNERTYMDNGQLVTVPNKMLDELYGRTINVDPRGPQGGAQQGAPSPAEIDSVRQSLVNTFGAQIGQQKFEEWRARNLGGR